MKSICDWQIGGERVGPGFYASKRAGWTREAIGTKVGITKSDGQTVILTLADYF